MNGSRLLGKLRARLSYANVVATLALFIALGGTSYGLATGSIDSREIKNSTVRSKDIRNNEVRSGDIRNRTLLARDFKPGELPVGPRGATGPAGAPGSSRAYARLVLSSGTLTVTRTKGVGQANFVVSSASNTICIRGLPFTPQNIVTSASSSGPPHIDLVAGIPPTGGACDAVPGAQAELRFIDSNSVFAQLSSGTGFVLIN